MRPARIALGVVLLVLALSACQHDYDKLQDPEATDIRGGQGGDSGSGGASGTGGSGSGGDSGTGGGDPDGGSGTGGSGGGGGTGGGGTPPDACEPCAELSEQALAAGLEACCRGLRNSTCGIAVSQDDDALCLARDVAGEPDATCPAIGPAGDRREGCCRPDGQCGAELEALGLGCVAREDIPEGLAPRADAIACRLPCEADADCAGVPDVATVCVPERDRAGMRYCVAQCQRDEDCGADQLCALSPDIEQDRLVAFCQGPYGDRTANEVCQSANQCDHGACLRPAAQTEATCSQLCVVKDDCPAISPFCIASQIGRPSGMGTPISFRVCSATAP